LPLGSVDPAVLGVITAVTASDPPAVGVVASGEITTVVAVLATVMETAGATELAKLTSPP